MKNAKKLLAILLTALTIMSAFSAATPVVAAEVQNAIADEIVFAGEDSVNEEEIAQTEAESNAPVVIGEDESRRTADTKHFIMSNGTRKAVIYGNAVHYEENGKWQEIDNTLSYDSEKEEYKNSKNGFKATFKKDFNAENMFSLENEGYIISWEYNGGLLRKSFTKAEYEEKKLSADKIQKYADKSQDKIKYKNFESNCELEYVVTSNGVKENIILNSKTGKNEFTFTVTAAGLVLSKNQDGSISALNNEKEEIFHIPAPFMYDAQGVYSYAVSYEVKELAEGKYSVSIVADKEWLKADIREYPVVIDPIILTKQTSTSVSSTFVAADTPSTNYGSVQDIYIGDESANYGLCHAMFKNTLPTLNKGDMVVEANLRLYMHSTSFDGGSSKRQLDAHIITSTWAENSVTWNTKPGINDKIIDYCFMNNGEYGWKELDITKAVKGWYEGTFANYGILVKAHDETLTPARAIFRSENATNITQGIPYITIEYRNNKGIESYWSYSNFSNGVGGIASVNEYTGNLVYTLPLTSSVSEIMPVSLSLVYNTYCSNDIYTAGKNSSNTTSVGKGWRLNYQQTLLESTKYGLTGESAEIYPYVYTDADGTEHYIGKYTENGQTVYKDEDGLGYTFSKPNGATDFYRLTKDDGSYMSFNNCGNLSAVVDNSDNRITLTYDSANKKLQKITDGTGHTFTLNYTSGTNYLSYIKDNADRKTYLYISNSVLTDVKLIDGSQVYFRYYDTGENLLNYVWTTDETGRRFTYNEQSKGRRVAQTFDFSATSVGLADYVVGQTVTFDRTAYNTTVIRSAGIDGIHNVTNANNGGDDIISTLQFDNFGRTVSQQVKYGNGESVGAGAYTYTGDDIEESRNRIQSSATLGKNTVNLLTNGNAEGTGSWTLAGRYGDVAYTYAAATDEAHYGKQSIKLTNSSMTQNSFSFLGQRVTGLTAGNNYTFSAYVKTKNLTLLNYNALQGAYLKAIAKNSSGTTLLTKNSSAIRNVTEETVNDGWRRISVTITIPSGTTYLDVYMLLGNATGTAYFDGLQLETGSVASSLNLLQNASFESYSSSGITTWTPSEGVTYTSEKDGTTTANVRNGARALKITGGGEAYKGFYQYVTVSPNENDTYILSGWAAAYAVNKTHHPDAKFEIAARVTYSVSDGSTVTQFKESAVFNTTISNWQYAAASFSLKYKKENTSDTKTYTPTHIMVMPRYNLQGNFAYFDHVQLVRDVAQSYIYDSEGNVTSVSANAEQKNNMTYEGEDLKTYKDAAGYTSEYSYDSSHRLTQAKSAKGVKVNYTYNNKGQVISVENQNVGGAVKTLTSQTYTEDYSSGTTNITAGAYLRTTTDELGNITTYGYYLPTGAQASITDAEERKTTYAYDESYTKLTKVVAQPASVVYNYDGNRVKSISLGYGTNNTYNETYNFEYDSFGNIKTTMVGTKPLSTNTYRANNGILLESNYGNNDGIKYSYTKAGNVSGIYYKDNQNGQSSATFSTNPLFTWAYTSNGLPRIHKDGATGYRYDYSYDSIGRLIRTDISKSSDSSFVGATEYGYDVRNNLTSIVNDIGGNDYVQLYSYSKNTIAESEANAKDNLPIRYVVLGLNTDYSYNSLNQLTARTVDTSGNDLTNQYFYNTKTGTSYYTNQLRCEVIEGASYHYGYDKVGNITSIGKGTGANSTPSNYRAYTYDDLNRLLTDTRYNQDTKTTYKYNHLGNITLKTNTNAAGTTTKSTIEYSYAKDTDAGWNYLLTKLTFKDSNGTITKTETIDYDAIGNPISYRGASMAWRGRQLTGYTKSGKTITMGYDADGLRSSKTVNSVKTTYQYVGDKLFYENRGNGDSFYYFYDSYGKLSAIYHHRNGTKVAYHVVTNAQGDVVSLYNWSGTHVASYDYDAWGNCTILSDTSSTGIATLNPFRYRGYYYDTDLGLYYLQSRYYDAEIGRFINADGFETIIATPNDVTDKNLYAYCDNNPVVRSDNGGNFWNVVIGAAVGAVAGFVGQVISDVVTSVLNGEVTISNWQTYTGAAIGGAAGGVVLATTGNMNAANAVTGAVTTGVGQSLEKLTISNYDKSWAEIGANAVVDGAVSFGLGKLPGINGATAGRNSWSAVYKSGLTKLRNGIATRMSAKVVAKGLGSSIVGGFSLDGYYGIKQHSYDRVKSLLA